MSDNNTNLAPFPQDAPTSFCGYHVEIEYLEGLPACGNFLAAVRTPDGLVLGFVRRAHRGLLRVDAFNEEASARYYQLSQIETVGRVVLKGRVAAVRRAAA
jgi:fructose 1,6-bisphosphatase